MGAPNSAIRRMAQRVQTVGAMSDRCSRRSFCGVLAGGVAAAAGASALPGCGNPVKPAPYTMAVVDENPSSPRYGQVAVAWSRYPDLSPIGGAITVELQPLMSSVHPFLVPQGGILLVHRGPAGATNEFVATQSLCPHAACPLGYSASQALIECPCHGSRFRAATDPTDPSTYPGQVVHPPARADLSVWKAPVEGDTVYIDLNSRVGSSLPAVANGQVVLPLSMFGALATVGGSLSGQPAGLGDVLIVARTDANTVVALSAVCTHAACDVDFAAGAGDFQCPCHGSIFGLDGTVTKGPATRPLKSYPVTFDGQTVTIQVA